MKKAYLTYMHYDVYSKFMSSLIWSALATYVIISRSILGVDIINIFEVLISIVPVLGTWIAYSKYINIKLKSIIMLDIIIETIFLISTIYLIYIDSKYCGIAIYIVILINITINPARKEKERLLEDKVLTHRYYKNILARLRKKNNYADTISGIIGASLSLVFISIYKIDINTFAIVMLSLNILNNLYDYLKWIKSFSNVN